MKKDPNCTKKTQELQSYVRPWINRKLFWIACIVVAGLSAYLVWDYHGPLEIRLRPDNACGLDCLRAEEGYDSQGYLWATRGIIAYKLREGDDKFVRQCHVPIGLSIFWLRNFSIVRRLALRPECVEFLAMPDGEICTMSGGHMWYRPANGKGFDKTLTLPHYGIGIGQGIRNDGLVRLRDGMILFGDYFMNTERTNV